LNGQGKTISLVVDSGEGETNVVPVFEGYCCVHVINTVSGGDVTKYLRQLLDKRGYTFTTNSEIKIVRKFQERFCETPILVRPFPAQWTLHTNFQTPAISSSALNESTTLKLYSTQHCMARKEMDCVIECISQS
jgi:hypothetical protein